MRRLLSLISIFIISFPSFSSLNVWAAFEAPLRTNLMLDLTASGGIQDLSIGQRYIQAFGDVSPVTESGSGMSYINFSGSGQITTTLGWNANDSAPFTLSFWIKAPTVSRLNDTPMITECPKVENGYRYFSLTDLPKYPDGSAIQSYYLWTSSLASLRISPYNDPLSAGCYKFYTSATAIQATDATPAYTVANGNGLIFTKSAADKVLEANPLPQTIFTFQKSGSGVADIGLKLTKDYQCQMEGSTNAFDCTKLQDNAWHFITFRRNYYRTFDVLIDSTKVLTLRDFSGTTGRSIFIGRSVIGSEPQYTRFKWNIASFRLYNADLTDEQLLTLSKEFSYPGNASDVPVINISQPSTVQSPTKQISAASSTGVLSFATTTSDTCNDTLSFDPYIDLTFSSINDNGIRVCYRAINGTKKTFKLSDPIRGITGTASSLSVDNVFGDGWIYKSWIASSRAKIGDYTRGILNAVPWTNFVDMNGDGIVDILYNNGGYLGIFVNNWNYTFSPAYKCKVEQVAPFTDQYGNPLKNYLYYGDCADTNYR